MKMKTLLVQLTPTAPCPLQVAPCEGRAPVLLAAALQVLENCDEVPPEPSLLQGEKT